jgi:hypothetical protein
MEVNMKIEAYFKSIKRANDTVSKLKNSGYEKSFIDIKDNISTDLNVTTNLAGTETSGSNSGLVLNSEGHLPNDDTSKSPLEAASPMVSGMGGFEEIADFNCRVVVEANQDNINQINEILSNMGGKLDNPDLRIPEHLKGIYNESIDM